MGKYNNRVELKGGEVVLFHRTGAKRPIWHMRIHVRGMHDLNGKKFSHIQETTGELDLEAAFKASQRQQPPKPIVPARKPTKPKPIKLIKAIKPVGPQPPRLR